MHAAPAPWSAPHQGGPAPPMHLPPPPQYSGMPQPHQPPPVSPAAPMGNMGAPAPMPWGSHQMPGPGFAPGPPAHHMQPGHMPMPHGQTPAHPPPPVRTCFSTAHSQPFLTLKTHSEVGGAFGCTALTETLFLFVSCTVCPP